MMKTLAFLMKRNVKLFFKDKGMFLTSLITPMILLVLYVSFLGDVYRDSFTMNLPEFINVSEKMIDGYVATQLISSILAVSCVTVAFCSNFLMVQDKVNGAIKDLRITPVKPSVLSLGYYLSSFVSTLLICFLATALCLAYVAMVGWYMSVLDVLMLYLDVFLLTLFGTALSSVINFFLSSQGQISAVGTLISSCYGFICGAYMPISSFNDGLQKVISFLPGTYGTSLVRLHSMRGVFEAMEEDGLPSEFIVSCMDAIDCNVYFFDNQVNEEMMYAILLTTIIVLIGAYIAQNALKKKVK